jgi:predicted amidohydrolase
VVAPTGEVLARAGSGPALVTAEVTRDALVASRLENTHLADRRPELYRGSIA